MLLAAAVVVSAVALVARYALIGFIGGAAAIIRRTILACIRRRLWRRLIVLQLLGGPGALFGGPHRCGTLGCIGVFVVELHGIALRRAWRVRPGAKHLEIEGAALNADGHLPVGYGNNLHIGKGIALLDVEHFVGAVAADESDAPLLARGYGKEGKVIRIERGLSWLRVWHLSRLDCYFLRLRCGRPGRIEQGAFRNFR